jgi:hypothetical protein
MPLPVTFNTSAEYLRTDCNILGDNKKALEVVQLTFRIFHKIVTGYSSGF